MKTRKHNDAKSAQLTKNTVDSKKERAIIDAAGINPIIVRIKKKVRSVLTAINLDTFQRIVPDQSSQRLVRKRMRRQRQSRKRHTPSDE